MVMWLYGRKLPIVCNYPGRFGDGMYCGSRDIFNLSREAMWPRVQRVVWFNWLKLPIVSNHLAKFIDRRSFGSSGIAGRIIEVNLNGHVIKGFDNFIEGNSSLYIPTVPKLIVRDIVLMNIEAF